LPRRPIGAQRGSWALPGAIHGNTCPEERAASWRGDRRTRTPRGPVLASQPVVRRDCGAAAGSPAAPAGPGPCGSASGTTSPVARRQRPCPWATPRTGGAGPRARTGASSRATGEGDGRLIGAPGASGGPSPRRPGAVGDAEAARGPIGRSNDRSADGGEPLDQLSFGHAADPTSGSRLELRLRALSQFSSFLRKVS
jgi:hypothetical protein